MLVTTMMTTTITTSSTTMIIEPTSMHQSTGENDEE